MARFGEHNIVSDDEAIVQDIKIVRSEKHRDYNNRDGRNDIAILKLEHDVKLSSK